jgi:hypothetical protein
MACPPEFLNFNGVLLQERNALLPTPNRVPGVKLSQQAHYNAFNGIFR